MDFPDRKNLIKTNEEDPLDYYYYPFVGYFYRRRLRDVLSLLDRGEAGRLLDIGFGSGIAFKELFKRTKNIYGLEVHRRVGDVQSMMAKEGIMTKLQTGSILDMPFENDFFDTVISISTLEHIKDLAGAFKEITRILKPGGRAILSFPARNVIMDNFYRLCGYKPRELHPSGHRDILNTGKIFMNLVAIKKFPGFLPFDLGFYISGEFKK